jgi:hypothetical protein
VAMLEGQVDAVVGSIPTVTAARDRPRQCCPAADRLVQSWPVPLGGRLCHAGRGGPGPGLLGSGVRHRLNRGGDRQLNRALYLVAITKQRCDPATKTYTARRTAEGKTDRETTRCIKRFIARRVWRLLEHPPITT